MTLEYKDAINSLRLRSPTAQKIRLCRQRIGWGRCRNLNEALLGSVCTDLDVSFNNICDRGFLLLCNDLPTTVTYLDLTACVFTAEPLSCLRNSNLKTLKLAHNYAMGQSFSSKHPLELPNSLVTLDLTHCNLNDAGFVMLFENLKTNQTLQNLQCDNMIDSRATAHVVADALVLNSSLTSLTLSLLTHADVVTPALVANTTLLSLQAFFVHSKRVAEVDEILSQNRTLTSLTWIPQLHELLPSARENWRILRIGMSSSNRVAQEIAQRNQALLWRNFHSTLLNLCLAMSPLDLPPYVVLEIVDWLPFVHVAVSHRHKIQLIESVRNSIRRLRNNEPCD